MFAFDNSFVREMHGLYEPWQAALVAAPSLLMLNESLAKEMGLDTDWLRSAEGIAMLVGNVVPPGSSPVAQAYAGHQFGGYSPRLGDGRALLIGELFDEYGDRRDLHLKGSGRTPFARGGDGKAAVGPMLREYLMGEAMHALSVPTTRALAVLATGEDIRRETMLPGAVLARIASSHLRVGTFQYAALHGDPTLVRRLADYAIARHYPDVRDSQNPYLAFLEQVVASQASLIARWMLVGFIHGVMNTDNMTISGETIDYGPCAFLDRYDPATVFSSIDHNGRYAYGKQPAIAQWNLARLAETLLPLFDGNPDLAIEQATDVLQTFPDQFHKHWTGGMQAKLGLGDACDGDDLLIDELLTLMHAQNVDFTGCFRTLSSSLISEDAKAKAGLLFASSNAFAHWYDGWQARVSSQHADLAAVAMGMNAINPVYIPRNHKVEEALSAATNGDLEPFEHLTRLLTKPFTERAGEEDFALPADSDSGPYQTFCGT